jgi:hypothetical protein
LLSGITDPIQIQIAFSDCLRAVRRNTLQVTTKVRFGVPSLSFSGSVPTHELIIMKYQAQLTPWVVYKVSDAGRFAVTRYRRRNDADAYAKRLSMTQPTFEFVVEFDTDSFPTPAAKELAPA